MSILGIHFYLYLHILLPIVWVFKLYIMMIYISAPVIFYGTTCVTTLMFLRVAMLWPALVRHIAHVEDQVPYYDKNLTYKCNATCAVVLSLALSKFLLLF